MFGIPKFLLVLVLIVVLGKYNNGAPAGEVVLSEASNINESSDTKNEVVGKVDPKEYLQEEQEIGVRGAENLAGVRFQRAAPLPGPAPAPKPKPEGDAEAPADAAPATTAKPASAAPRSFKPEFLVILLAVTILKCVSVV